MSQGNTTITRKVGSNRGKARLWIEGASLLGHAWKQGKTFVTLWGEGQLTYCALTHPDFGKPERKVAGTAERPIIDTNTDKILTTLGVAVGDIVTITITRDTIVVRKNATADA